MADPDQLAEAHENQRQQTKIETIGYNPYYLVIKLAKPTNFSCWSSETKTKNFLK